MTRRSYAFLVRPHLGGTYTVYRSLRAGLGPDASLRWVGVGPDAHAVVRDPAWTHEHAAGSVVGEEGVSDRETAYALLDHLESGSYDGVFVNVLTSPVEMNVVRFLDRAIRRIMIVHSISPGTYRAAAALRGHVDTTVGVSPRIVTDLVRNHGFENGTILCIPNAADVPTLERDRTSTRGPLKVLSLGRIDDGSKGVFWIPEIMRRVADPGVRLTVAGAGPDLPELRRRCADIRSRVEFAGAVPPQDAAALAQTHDVLLMPSRFEGLPTALVEGMAAGCVPVASRIGGVTDFVVEHGRNGMLFRIGDVTQAAALLNTLSRDPVLLRRLSHAARETARSRFSVSAMGEAYRALLERRCGTTAAPLGRSEWGFPRAFSPGVRRWIPLWAKNVARAWRA